jgi:hypothetical protein
VEQLGGQFTHERSQSENCQLLFANCNLYTLGIAISHIYTDPVARKTQNQLLEKFDKSCRKVSRDVRITPHHDVGLLARTNDL